MQSGGVLASVKQPHESARALRAFNDKLVNDPRVVCVLTTVRDGVTSSVAAGCGRRGDPGGAGLPPASVAPRGSETPLAVEQLAEYGAAPRPPG